MERAKTDKTGSSSREKDAIALLKADHRQVEEWFEQFEKARNVDRKQELATRICNALTVHTTIEEEIFYPAFLRPPTTRTCTTRRRSSTKAPRT